MNHYGAKELAASFRTVRKNTLQVAEEIGEDKYGYVAAPGVRPVGQTLAHIALQPAFMYQLMGKNKKPSFEGFDFPKFMAAAIANVEKLRSKAELIALLKEEGENYAKWLETFTDDELAFVLHMPPGGNPPSRSVFDMLLGVKEHEMHHRGQLMLIERQLGIVPHLTRAQMERIAAMKAAATEPASARA